MVKKFHPSSPLEVAGLGLGTGSVSCLLRSQDHIQFFEIDPDIIRIASNPDIFSYLHDCPPKYDLSQGDARLKIQDFADKSYDLMLVDVFSSDNIPLHLITKQAVELYLSKIKENGIVVFHITNRYFTLESELALITSSLNVPALSKTSFPGNVDGTEYQFLHTMSVVMTFNEDYIKTLGAQGWTRLNTNDKRIPWSDDFANPLRAMYLQC